MLNIGNKNFMNLQEAVGWLLENNALPFQSTANYAGNTEIAMSTLINPSPAKVRVGSIIFFADSKVSTVVGVTTNSFIVSEQYNDLVDDVVYVANVAQNASGHLIVTLSNGDTIDAGLIKQIASLNINASQHFIVTYNDGTSADLGSLGDYSNVDFVAKTLSQTQANWKSSSFNFSNVAGLTFTNIYNRFELINGVLYCIVNLKIKNETANSISFIGGDVPVQLPASIASEIIDIEGNSVADAGATNYAFIAGDVVINLKNGTTYTYARNDGWKIYLCNRNIANYCGVFIRLDSAMTFDPNDEIYLSGRIPLTVI